MEIIKTKITLTPEIESMLSEFSEDALNDIAKFNLIDMPEGVSASSRGDTALYVSMMPNLPQGWKGGVRFMEGKMDEATERAFATRRAEYRVDHPELIDDQFPDVHDTIIFGHNPTAENAKQTVVNATPDGVFAFHRVQALGETGKENCWGVVSDDPALIKWMTDARNDPDLKSDAVKGNWPVASSGFDTVIPHATFVRNLVPTIADVNQGPDLSVLLGKETSCIVCVMEWASMMHPSSKKKLKLAKFWPLGKRIVKK